MASDWFEIFRTGWHTDAAGNRREWTAEDLEKIAGSYDPAQHEAPIVIGHPTMDAPAYGWIEALQAEGGKLLAKPKQLAEAFTQLVREGRFKKVSMAVYPDLTLRHVGFLGAMPPAVKGLAPAQFADAGRAWTYLEPYQERSIRSLFQRLRDWLIEEKGVESADKIISPWDLEALTPAPAADAGPVPAYAEPGASAPPTSPSGEGGTGMREWLKQFQARLAALFAEAEKTLPADGAAPTAPTVKMFSEAEVNAKVAAEYERATKAAEAKAARERKVADAKARVTTFVEAGIAAGTFLPAWRERGLPAVLEQALLVEQPLTFAEGKEPANPGEILLGLFAEMPKLVPLGEVAKPPKGPAGDTAAAKLEALTQARMAEKKIPYNLAFAEIQREHVDLARQYAEELGGR